MRIAARIAFPLIAAALALAPVACGSLQAPAGTPNAPMATATALFRNINRKRALQNEPTFSAGVDPLRPFANVTVPPDEAAARGSSPTPESPACGATISGWSAVLTRYGALYGSNACEVIDGELVITTRGLAGGPGAIATYRCAMSDTSCLAGRNPKAAAASWSVFPSPLPAPVTILQFTPPHTLIVETGGTQVCFDLDTHQYDETRGCSS